MSNTLVRDVAEPVPIIQDSVLSRYFVAVLSACVAETVTYPLDLAKTRLQLQNEVAAVKSGLHMEYRGLISTAINISTKEGVLKLWSGLLPMFHRHMLYSGCRLVFYEQIRNLLLDENGRLSLGFSIICGATCGAMAQIIASPADLVKVQMQAEGHRIQQSKPPRFSGCKQAYTMIYNKSGIMGFWRGSIPNAQRAALVNIGDLAAYDYSKHYLKRQFAMKDGILLHTLSAFIAGLVGAVLCTPADLIKTRLMNQSMGPDGKGTLYKNSVDCLIQSVTNEGFFVLYKGFVPLWFRIGPWMVLNWIAFEYIMNSIGGKPF
ncbi:unnamed protein product [Arctia plantaginis]|uniref:Uncharacterized protein n=1 Tax=Arctia plantaginis TaxID=874455 RepID=A0A8S0YY35_ARCPL|nr:unnamed protein product [Arctia plantaginis]